MGSACSPGLASIHPLSEKNRILVGGASSFRKPSLHATTSPTIPNGSNHNHRNSRDQSPTFTAIARNSVVPHAVTDEVDRTTSGNTIGGGSATTHPNSFSVSHLTSAEFVSPTSSHVSTTDPGETTAGSINGGGGDTCCSPTGSASPAQAGSPVCSLLAPFLLWSRDPNLSDAEWDHLRNLGSFLPWGVIHRAFRNPEKLTQSEVNRFTGTLMMVDISGFTTLGEALSALPDGVELLTKHVNNFFRPIINCIHEFAGSIERFAGDALIVAFGQQFLCPRTAIHLAIHCALQIQSRFPTYFVPIPGQEAPVELGVHIGIAYGEMAVAAFGGVNDHWRRVLLGEPFEQLAVVMPQSKRGDVVMSQKAYDLYNGRLLGFINRVKAAIAELWIKNLETKTHAKEIAPGAWLMVPGDDKAYYAPGKCRCQRDMVHRLTVRKDMEKVLRQFIDWSVLKQIDSGHIKTVAELRMMSVLFIGLDIQYNLKKCCTEASKSSFCTLNQCIVAIQKVVVKYEGSIANCLVDEKGTSVIVTFGAIQHEDDALRAIRTAFRIHQDMKQLQVRCHIGVTAGRVFYGEMGNEHRREQSIMGPVVNMAARIMASCDKLKHDIVVCKNCRDLTSQMVEYVELPSIKAKGISYELAVYYPSHIKRDVLDWGSDEILRGRGGELDNIEFSVRLKQREWFECMLRSSFEETSCGGCMQHVLTLLHGAEGSGKTMLLRELRRIFHRLSVDSSAGRVLAGSAGELDGEEAFCIWQLIFQALIGSRDDEVVRSFLIPRLKPRFPDVERYLPLVNSVLHTTFPITQATKELPQDAADDLLEEMLSELIWMEAHQKPPMIILLDDIHNVRHHGSLSLLDRVVAKADQFNETERLHLRIIATLRPRDHAGASHGLSRDETIAQFIARLPERPYLTQCCKLFPLSLTETEELMLEIMKTVGVELISPEIVAEVAKKASGRPLFVVEITRLLRNILKSDQPGAAVGVQDKALVPLKFDELTRKVLLPPLPDNMTGFIRARIDRLPADTQFVLKCASICAHLFQPQTLTHLIQPYIALTEQEVTSHLDVLRRKNMIILVDQEMSLFAFADNMLQEAAYGLLLFEQRKTLHKRTAEYLESKIPFFAQRGKQRREEASQKLTSPDISTSSSEATTKTLSRVSISASSVSSDSSDDTDLDPDVSIKVVTELAHHWLKFIELGGDAQPRDLRNAIRCLRRLSEYYTDLHNLAASRLFIEKALGLVRQLAVTPHAELLELRIRFQMLSTMRKSLHEEISANEWESIEQFSDRLWVLAQRYPDLDEGFVLFVVALALSRRASMSGQWAKGREIGMIALQLAEKHFDDHWLLCIYTQLVISNYALGIHTHTIDYIEKGVAIYLKDPQYHDTAPTSRFFPEFSFGCSILEFGSRLYYLMARFADHERLIQHYEALRTLDENSRWHLRLLPTLFACYITALKGDKERLTADSEMVCQMNVVRGVGWAIDYAQMYNGYAKVLHQKFEEGIRMQEEAFAHLSKSGANPIFMFLLAKSYFEAQKWDKCVAICDIGLASPQVTFDPEFYRIKAMVLWHSREPNSPTSADPTTKQVRELLRKGLDSARQQGLLLWEMRIRKDQAQISGDVEGVETMVLDESLR